MTSRSLSCPERRSALLGPNGTGKSTLLRMMAGVEHPSNGDARLMPGFTVGILDQEPAWTIPRRSLATSRKASPRPRRSLDRYNEIAEQMATDYSDELLEEMGRLQEQLDHKNAWDLESQLDQAMDALRCPPPDADVTVLSGGERRRVALCKLLLSQPDLLLLDEPTNHLDAESVQWLEQHLEKYPGTVVAVTHDRYFLDNVAGWILELDRGRALPLRGQLLHLPGDQGGPAQGRGPEGREEAQAPGGRAGVGPVQPARSPGQEPLAAAALRGDGRRGRPGPEARLRGDPDPAGPAPWHAGCRGQRPDARASTTGP